MRKVHKVHKVVYEKHWRGRYPFIFAYALCNGDMAAKVKSAWPSVTCKRCLAKRKGKK